MIRFIERLGTFNHYKPLLQRFVQKPDDVEHADAAAGSDRRIKLRKR